MKKQDYMWELQYPFPYADATFIRTYKSLLLALDERDAAQAESLRKELRESLSSMDWEYLTWQEWKEGLARYLENRIRQMVGLPENKGGETEPYSRVTFYRGGDALIRFLEGQHPGISTNMERLYRMISLIRDKKRHPDSLSPFIGSHNATRMLA
jgi:hypothetical protein